MASPIPPNVQQTPDGTSYDSAPPSAGGAQGGCTKVEIIPLSGSAPGKGGFTVNCYSASSAQPQSSVANSPQELIATVGQALGLAAPPTDSDMTTESASAAAPAPSGAGGY